MEAAYAFKVSLFICEAQSHILENQNLTNHHCEKLKLFKITVLSVMKQITKQLIGVEQHKSYVIIPLHHMQEIWNKKSHRNIPIDGLEVFTAMIMTFVLLKDVYY